MLDSYSLVPDQLTRGVPVSELYRRKLLNESAIYAKDVQRNIGALLDAKRAHNVGHWSVGGERGLGPLQRGVGKVDICGRPAVLAAGQTRTRRIIRVTNESFQRFRERDR